MHKRETTLLRDAPALKEEEKPLLSNGSEAGARSQSLFHYIEAAKQSQEISSETAGWAWSTWKRLDTTLSHCLPVPDVSYGPDGQFLFIWDKEEHHLELEIEPSGEGYFFYRNRTTGKLWDSAYTVSSDLTEEIIEKLRVVA